MQRDPRAFLWDAREAALNIQSFTSGLDSAAYADSELVQAAVERKFDVIGEALNQLAKVEPSLAARIADLPQIVAFLAGHAHAAHNPTSFHLPRIL